MDLNPYRAPLETESASDEQRKRICDRLKPPSTALLLLGSALGIGITLLIATGVTFELRFAGDLTTFLQRFRGDASFVSLLSIASGWLLLIGWGAWQMRRLRSYRWAMAAALLALIPTPLGWLTIPLGIWALIILRKPEVRAAFDR